MKKRFITVLIAIITVIPLVLVTPKANTGATLNGSGTSNYGSYTYQFSVILEQTEVSFGAGADNIGFSIPLATGSSFSLHYQFKDTYTGYVQFTLKSNTNVPYRLDQCYWGVNGGYFNSSYLPSLTTVSNSKQFRIYVYNATEFTFTIVSDNVNTFHPNSTQYTGFGVSTFGYVLTDVGDVPDISANLDLYLPGMSTSLSNIDGDLDNINQNIQALSPYIDQLESYVDGLEGLLSTIRDYTNNMNYILRFNNIEPWQYNALCWPWYNTNANTVTYAYERGLIYFNYSTSNNNGAYYDPKCIKIPAYGHLGFYFYTDKAISSADVHFYASNNNTDLSGMVLQNNFFQSGGPYYKNLIHFENKSNSYIYLTLEFTKDMKIYPLFLGNINNTPDEVADLYGIEYGNTYTRLLQSINNGIGVLNDDYDTSTYDNYEQTLDGLNDGLRGRFDNVDNNMQTNVDTLFTPSGTAGSDGSVFEKFHFNAVNSFMSGFINRIFTTFPAFKYILIFGLLLLVIGVMI